MKEKVNNNSEHVAFTTKTGVEILVFSTSIQNERDIVRIKEALDNFPGILSWNVDMEDWEKILRIECVGVSSNNIVEVLYLKGLYIKELL